MGLGPIKLVFFILSLVLALSFRICTIKNNRWISEREIYVTPEDGITEVDVSISERIHLLTGSSQLSEILAAEENDPEVPEMVAAEEEIPQPSEILPTAEDESALPFEALGTENEFPQPSQISTSSEEGRSQPEESTSIPESIATDIPNLIASVPGDIQQLPTRPTTGKGISYVICSQCKTAYLISEKELRRGAKVKCGVCDKEWFQTVERMLYTDESSMIMNMTEAKIADVKRILADRNIPRHPRVDRVPIFVGNLPYTYDENDIVNLFAEYGVINCALVRDSTGLSKGFAFVEVSNQEDANQMIKEMHYFYTDAQRRLTVRLADDKASGPGGAGGRGGDGGGPSSFGGRGGRGGGPGGRGGEGGRGGRGGEGGRGGRSGGRSYTPRSGGSSNFGPR